jgi:CHAT domain-containing protein
MKSGLILAGNRRFSPNLTVSGYFKLQLHADLVTLSGCQTALGKTIKGDEVIGLSRAFMFSGTPSVVSSF